MASVAVAGICMPNKSHSTCVVLVSTQTKSVRIVRKLIESTNLLALAQASESRVTLVLAEWVVDFVARFDSHHSGAAEQ